MTNHEKYKAAFSVLQPTRELELEVPTMEGQKRTIRHKPVLALCAAVLTLAVLALSVIAADVGGIQTTLKTWFRGREETVSVSERDDGGYDFAVTDENGETAATFGGGGVAYENGKERALTPQEVLESNELEVVVEENGKATLYFRDRTYDITDLFNADGVCKVKLKDETKKLFKSGYVDVELEGDSSNPFTGYSVSTSGLPHGGRSAYVALDD